VNLKDPYRNKKIRIKAMGIILLAMFVPFFVLSVAAVSVGKRIRRGEAITKSAYVVLGLQLTATIWSCVNALTSPEFLKWANDYLAIFMLAFTAVCSLIIFTPKSKVFEKNR
jgi:membrane-associated PAP2 superfamily phosphatase